MDDVRSERALTQKLMHYAEKSVEHTPLKLPSIPLELKQHWEKQTVKRLAGTLSWSYNIFLEDIQEEATVKVADVVLMLTEIKSRINVLEEDNIKTFIINKINEGLKTIPDDLLKVSKVIDKYTQNIGTISVEMRLFVDQEDPSWKHLMLTIYVKDKTPAQLLDIQHDIYNNIYEKIHDLANCLLVRVLPY